ncbi:thioredoxin domain-containing protein [Arsenicibacter rosenii]|uniref:Thioredoxin domain-containing protein n=1 Tax=Arsenicibacter rosenii TaxID=1750698 RepID=A0A1S2VQL9_9BACT|nr:thioredoxin domain-containing protein [Arsenicibacter rosenii]OIN60680.1 thioredoxin domain-containing protein [Arsenicibacter rosenii]
MNRLANETSPYLLQHAHNPVDWYPWGEEALTKARDENKPILVSIGYSACHWCHVMERESFEKEGIARVMNEHFVCIKVDREERPDVDAIYMDAVQAMGVRGGWPLNVFLVPDAKPFYGVTYLPPQQWVNLLNSVQNAFQEHRDQLFESAEGFANELNISESSRFSLAAANPLFSEETVEAMFQKLAGSFDRQKGGMNRAPKFPMPGIYSFLLNYIHLTDSPGRPTAQSQVALTLDRMALGGIYDQLGGGFARYSVDDHWFAPHFEKMLYDNGQLLTLYSQAYSLTKRPLYKHVVYQTIHFAQRELLSPDGGFYSALDADSEGEEGRFYTWTTDELRQILGIDFDWFADLYHIREEGNFEHGRNILHRIDTDETFAERAGWTPEEFDVQLAAAHTRLFKRRDERIRPGLDDKILCSWNGLMLKGLVTAYRVFDEPEFLATAIRLAHFLLHKMRDQRNGRLWHSYKQGRAKQPGFLEDYAAVIDGLLALYQATFTESFLTEADRLTKYVLDNFSDPDDDLLFFTDKNGEELIARRKELFDNVMPASNSIMAGNFYTLSLLLDRPLYGQKADQMLGRIQPLLQSNADYLTNWAALYTLRVKPTAEIAIVGPDAQAFRCELDKHFRPNVIFCGTESSSQLPLLQSRTTVNGQTAIYVCYNRACQMPVTTVAAALENLA